MAIVNPVLFNPNVKDSRWLTLDVCREYTRNKCTRTDDECRFAHPPPNVEVQNGRVMCCFDSIKGKCQRREPPCKYLHPPQHLKEQLLQNGRNNLILRHLHMQLIMNGMQGSTTAMYPIIYDINGSKSFNSSYPAVSGQESYMTQPYLVQNGTTYNPYFSPTTFAAVSVPAAVDSSGTAVPFTMATTPNSAHMITQQPNIVQNECCEQQPQPPQQQQQHHLGDGSPLNPNATLNSNSSFNQCHQQPASSWHGSTPPSPTVIALDSTGSNGTYCSQMFLQGAATAGPGMPTMIPVIKRSAMTDSKYGVPVYHQPAALAYQQMALAALQLQPPAYVPYTFTGHPAPMIPRY